MCNMAVEVAISNHLTRRNGVWQYVRRVPEDVRDVFPFTRVQKSLRTEVERRAREAALDLDRLWDGRFAEARERKGLVSNTGELAAIGTDGWAWPDWEALAAWFEASLAEEDWQARLLTITGPVLSKDADPSRIPWRDAVTAREHIDREMLLRSISVSEYGEARASFVRSYIRRLGVALTRSDPNFLRFMAACHAAELSYLDLFRLRESRQGGIGNTHPDAIEGTWRQLRGSHPHEAAPFQGGAPTDASSAMVPSPTAPSSAGGWAGKTLTHCIDKWVSNRRSAKQAVRDHHLSDMRKTVAAFEAHTGLRDIGLITRRHVLAFRDQLNSRPDYKTATVNKKVSYITSLLSTALNAGWIDREIGSKVFLQVPGDEGTREAFTDPQLTAIFSHRIFTSGYRSSSVKACGELQFWLPLIACMHGMISSEILQLGPDTVLPHDEYPEILCFSVTNAGGRTTKTLARRRWVPIRRELLDLGLLDLVERARHEDRPWLWPAMDKDGKTLARISNYASTFFGNILRKDLTITEPGLSLYSFRHGFQDRVGRAGYGEEVKKALMGHADTGMTGRYGTKKAPKPVDIVKLNEAIQTLSWPFLKDIRAAATATGGDVTKAARRSKPPIARERAVPTHETTLAAGSHL